MENREGEVVRRAVRVATERTIVKGEQPIVSCLGVRRRCDLATRVEEVLNRSALLSKGAACGASGAGRYVETVAGCVSAFGN